MKYDRLHTFKINHEIDGKTVEKEFFLRKPNRRLIEDGELFHGQQINNAIMRHGLIPRALLAKKFAEHEGVYTDKEKEEYQKLLSNARKWETELQTILMKDDKARSKIEIEKISEYQDKLFQCRMDIRNFELQEDSLYEHTAENYARKKVIFWWVTQLSFFCSDDGEELIVLEGDSYDEKMDHYEKLVEDKKNRSMWENAVSKLSYYTAIWLNPNIAGDTESFKQAIELLEADNNLSVVSEDEVEPVKEKKVAKKSTRKKLPKKDSDGEQAE